MPTALPPTPRDFNIHHLCLVQLQSTRRVAEIHHISQTRVRQIVARVSRWLAAALPIKTDLEIQQQAQLAQHLAADQMRHQLESLQNIFEASGDPKYLRHLTRIIAAQARLGVVPGQIEALAADAIDGPYDPTEPQPPWSEDDVSRSANPQSEIRNPQSTAPTPHSEFRTPHSSPIRNPKSASSTPHSEFRTPHSSPIPNPQSAAPSPHSEFRTPHSSPPPSEDCSPQNGSRPAQTESPSAAATATSDPVATSSANRHLEESNLRGLNLMEQRLLILIANTAPAETERLASLHNTLDEVRTSKAAVELRLAPTIPGAAVHVETSSAITLRNSCRRYKHKRAKPAKNERPISPLLTMLCFLCLLLFKKCFRHNLTLSLGWLLFTICPAKAHGRRPDFIHQFAICISQFAIRMLSCHLSAPFRVIRGPSPVPSPKIPLPLGEGGRAAAGEGVLSYFRTKPLHEDSCSLFAPQSAF